MKPRKKQLAQVRPIIRVLLPIHTGRSFVAIEEVEAIVAKDGYSELWFVDGTKLMVFLTLNEMEKRLCCGKRFGKLLFMRIHRQHILAVHYADEMPNAKTISSFGKDWSVGRRYYNDLIDTVGVLNCRSTLNK